MKENYQYPLETYWSRAEMLAVISFYQAVEEAYEKGIAVDRFMDCYRDFKEVVPAIGEEKRLGREFEEASGYSIYRAVKQAKEMKQGKLKMKL